jgi:hypothetical protein
MGCTLSAQIEGFLLPFQCMNLYMMASTLSVLGIKFSWSHRGFPTS